MTARTHMTARTMHARAMKPPRRPGTALVVAALLSLSGCALQTVPPPASPPPPASTPATSAPSPAQPPATTPASGTQVGTTASGGTIRINGSPDSLAPVPAVADSTPSPEALEVLASIPEPLGRPSDPPPARRAPAAPPTSVPASGRGEQPAAAGESAAPDTGSVPVPAPTSALGDRPGARATIPDSALAPPPPAATAAPPPAQGAAPPPATDTGPCWRVQVAAKPERARSERLMAAAQSQLEVPWVVEREDGLHKVRTRDCFTEAAAEALRKRAIAAGFEGSFKVRKR